MNLRVVSDLHIWGAEDPLYRALISLLSEKASAEDVVVLAGDIFDLFVGAKSIFTGQYAEFIRAVQDAGSRGVQIHYIEGNHDFQLESVFAQDRSLQLHAESVSLSLEGKRFFIAHGDLADREDRAYRFLRGALRSVPMKWVIRLVPDRLVDRVGKRSSQYSRGKKATLVEELPIEKRERLRTAYRSYAAERLCEGFDFVILGHCHDLDEKLFRLDGREGQYINVGYPRAHGSYLRWQSGESKVFREKLF